MTKSIEVNKVFLVPTRVLYRAFLDSQDLSRMLMSPASITPAVGGSFSYFNGGVSGSVTHMDPDSEIQQSWRFAQWEDNVFSTLQISFESLGPEKTEIIVKQTGIPENDKHGNGGQDRLVLSGWNDRFFLGLEKILGFPVERD
jgi:activator of HSP90 ATPase